MTREQELLQKFLDILCNDFEVEKKPKLIYTEIPPEKFMGIGGVYSPEHLTIQINVFNFRTVIHEFTHHLQFEQVEWDFKKYISQFTGSRMIAHHIAMTHELEADAMDIALNKIYADIINRIELGFKAEPLGRAELCRRLVKYILDDFLSRVDEELHKADYILETETDPLSKDILEIFLEIFDRIHGVYDWVKRILKYTIRVCTKQWRVPESIKFDHCITIIRYKTDSCSDILEKAINNYIPIPSKREIKKDIEEIKRLHIEFKDLLLMISPI
jgi:hypothetical protein